MGNVLLKLCIAFSCTFFIGKCLRAQSLFVNDGHYFRGDFHVHATGASNDTGGDSFPSRIKERAQERGLYFVVLQDHSNSTGSDVSTTEEDPNLFNMGNEFPYWDSCQILSEAGKFLMVDGNEISPIVEGQIPLLPTGHIGCVPRDIETFDTSGVFVDRPRGSVNGADVLEQSNERGAFSIINHPFAPTPWINYDWTDRENYHGMEVWNGTGGFDPFDQISYDLWRADRLQGLNVCPIGASDNHRVNVDPAIGAVPDLLNPALGFPTTSVLAKDGTWPSIIEGLEKGMVCIHEGESFLELRGYDTNGEANEGPNMSSIRLKGKLDGRAALPFTLIFQQAFSAIDARPFQGIATIAGTSVPLALVLPGDSFDIEVPVLINRGLFTAQLIPSVPLSGGRETHFVALSRGILAGETITSVQEQERQQVFEIVGKNEQHLDLQLFHHQSTSVVVKQISLQGEVLAKQLYDLHSKPRVLQFPYSPAAIGIIFLEFSDGTQAVRRIKL